MSFISDYLFTLENTKPAQEYNIWSMLSALSAFAGRRFWFPFGPINFYTNLYVVLVGEPGNGKSTAMNRTKNIVRASGICPIAVTQITKEALTQKMSGGPDGKQDFEGKKTFYHELRPKEYNQYAIFATELVDFIAVNPQGFLDFLTTVWDEPVYEVETKNKGCNYIVGPYITMLACMTPEKLKGYMKMSILTGGFARRTAFMYSSHKNIVPWPSYTDEQKAAELRCINFGKNLQKRSGPFGITDDCKRLYEQWNQENEEELKNRHVYTRGWYESKGEMLFKIAMLVSLAETDKLVIEVPAYRLAMRFCDMLERTLERVFEGTGVNPNAAVASQVCRMLEALGKPMNKKTIQAMFGEQATSWNEFSDTLTHLVSVGKLTSRDVSINGSFLGTLIGTPKAFEGLTDRALASVLATQPVLPAVSYTDQSPLTDLVDLHEGRQAETGESEGPTHVAPTPETSDAEVPDLVIDLSEVQSAPPDLGSAASQIESSSPPDEQKSP